MVEAEAYGYVGERGDLCSRAAAESTWRVDWGADLASQLESRLRSRLASRLLASRLRALLRLGKKQREGASEEATAAGRGIDDRAAISAGEALVKELTALHVDVQAFISRGICHLFPSAGRCQLTS